MYKVLVVDDERKIREFLSFFLKKEGYEVIEASNGLEAINILKEGTVDLVLLDLMMPVLNGFEASKGIRTFSNVPIIMLTAVEGEADHIEGYEAGVDDYITKPFKMPILMAKLKRLFSDKRIKNLYINSLKIDTDSREVSLEDEKIQLAPKEYDLLVYMIENKNIALSRDQLLEAVWGFDFEGGTRVVDNHIKKLRSKLGAFSASIVTVTGIGYKIEVTS
jgi:DNA-binding response OmpR family regulator